MLCYVMLCYAAAAAAGYIWYFMLWGGGAHKTLIGIFLCAHCAGWLGEALIHPSI